MHKNLEKLIETRSECIMHLECIKNVAEVEKRAFTPDELKKINSYKAEVEKLNKSIKELEGKLKFEKRSIGNDEIIQPNEKLETRNVDNDKNEDGVSLLSLTKGMATGQWNDAESRNYFQTRSMQTNGNASVTVPKSLYNRIVDIARAESAVFGQIPMTTMEHNNMTIVKQVGDAECNFVDEGQLIPASQPIFEEVDLKGKTLACFIPISEQLLDSNAVGLESQLMTSIARAISVTLDKALLYGKGECGVSYGQDGWFNSEIKGLTSYENINKAQYEGVGFGSVMAGIKPMRKGNIQPTHVAMGSDTFCDLESLVDANGQPIIPPRYFEKLTKCVSNNVNDAQVVVYNKDALLLGLHKSLRIEWGTSADQFQRLQRGLRVYIRADLGVIKEEGVAVVDLAA